MFNLKSKTTKQVVEWTVIIVIIFVVKYFGLLSPTVSYIQSLVLKTGLLSPNIELEKEQSQVNYNFDLINKDGEVLPFTQYKDKTVLVNFWEPWCAPCVGEMSGINALNNKIKKNNDSIKLILISSEKDFEAAKGFMSKKDYDLDIFTAPFGLGRNFNHQTIPTSYLINRNGRIVWKVSGIMNYDDQAFYAFLLNQNKKSDTSY